MSIWLDDTAKSLGIGEWWITVNSATKYLNDYSKVDNYTVRAVGSYLTSKGVPRRSTRRGSKVYIEYQLNIHPDLIPPF